MTTSTSLSEIMERDGCMNGLISRLIGQIRQNNLGMVFLRKGRCHQDGNNDIMPWKSDDELLTEWTVTQSLG